MFELIGLLGGALFAVGCMPVAWQSIKTGKSVGTPLTTMWLLAISLTLYSVYLFGTFGAHLPFWFMIVELVCWSVALWYHYFPRGWIGSEEMHWGMMGVGGPGWIPILDKDPSEGGQCIGYRHKSGKEFFFDTPKPLDQI